MGYSEGTKLTIISSGVGSGSSFPVFLRVERRALAAGVGSGSSSWASCSGSRVEVARLRLELLFTRFALTPCSGCAVEIKSDESGSGSGCVAHVVG
jgi:hypothetical protein